MIKGRQSGQVPRSYNMADNWNNILSPPPVAASIAPSLDVECLAKIWAFAGQGECALDHEDVLPKILMSGDTAKEVLALKMAGGWHLEQLFQCAKKSETHELALVSNERMDWYSLFEDSEEQLNELLARDAKNPEGGDIVEFAALNPRMHRRVIADLIRGKEPFDSVSQSVRKKVAALALQVRYEEEPIYLGQDMPSIYWMDFAKPCEALFSMVRQGEMEAPISPFASLIQRSLSVVRVFGTKSGLT